MAKTVTAVSFSEMLEEYLQLTFAYSGLDTSRIWLFNPALDTDMGEKQIAQRLSDLAKGLNLLAPGMVVFEEEEIQVDRWRNKLPRIEPYKVES